MDHLTSGDVMTVLYAVIGISLSVWATLIGMAMIFGRRASRSEDLIEQSPWKCFWIGLAVWAPLSFVAILLLQAPPAPAKIAGWALLSYLLALSAIGGGGFALMLAQRVGKMDTGLSRFTSLARAAALLVLISLVPLFGWFAYTPVVILMSLGAGVQAIFTKPERLPAGYQAEALL